MRREAWHTPRNMPIHNSKGYPVSGGVKYKGVEKIKKNSIAAVRHSYHNKSAGIGLVTCLQEVPRQKALLLGLSFLAVYHVFGNEINCFQLIALLGIYGSTLFPFHKTTLFWLRPCRKFQVSLQCMHVCTGASSITHAFDTEDSQLRSIYISVSYIGLVHAQRDACTNRHQNWLTGVHCVAIYAYQVL